MRTRHLAAVLACLALVSPEAAPVAPPPAFPGAEGFGARTPGGRGGRVLVVRTLEDSGPGSFREAVTAKGPRTVVFATGGLITLRSAVEITEPFLTIAGQTAPGDGICLRGNQVSIRTHDVIVRYLRFRPGDIAKAEVDSLDIMGEAHDVIVDHCSTTWSVDENLSPSGAVHDITVQWCLIAEALNKSVHRKGEHGYGSLVRAVGGVTLHHNLWAHNIARNPRLGDNYAKPPYPLFDVRNNVIYDYGKIASGLTGDTLRANYVANYVRPGPSSDRQRGVIVFADTANTTYFVQGNVVEHRPDWTADNTKLFDRTEFEGRRLVSVAQQPFDTPAVRTTSAAEALQEVLAGVGATLPRRDTVDARIVKSVGDRNGTIIDGQAQVGGWPEYRAGTPPADADADGVPDEWERRHGLNPRDASDAAKVGDKAGYTNLEVYLNELAAPDPPASAPRDEGGVSQEWVLDNLERIGGHAVTVVGAPRVVETPVGKAVEFDGRQDGVFLDVNPIAGLSQFTVEALFQPASGGPEEQRFLHLQENGSENRVMMETRTLGSSWCLDTFLRHDPASLTLIDRTRLHAADAWHVAALVYDGRTMTHYVDGVRDAEGTVSFAPLGAGRTSVGVRQNKVSWFRGRIRLLRFTPRALAVSGMLTIGGSRTSPR